MLSDAEVSKLEAEHGRVLVYEVDGADVVFARPKRAAYMRFVDMISDGQKSAAMHAFVRSCAVLPADAKQLESIFDAAPGLIVQASADLQQLAGAGVQAVKKGG